MMEGVPGRCRLRYSRLFRSAAVLPRWQGVSVKALPRMACFHIDRRSSGGAHSRVLTAGIERSRPMTVTGRMWTV